MDELDLIAAYARMLAAALVRAGRPVQPLVDEAVAHLLEDAARIARAEGCSEVEAARRAIARFGDVGTVVAAARRNGRALAASVARITSLVLFAVVSWNILTTFLDPSWRPLVEDALWVNFAAAVGLSAVVVDRGLAGGRRAGRLLPPLLVINGLFAAALLIGQLVSDTIQQRSVGHSFLGVAMMAEPMWLLMLVQSIAGLYAHRASRTRDGELALA